VMSGLTRRRASRGLKRVVGGASASGRPCENPEVSMSVYHIVIKFFESFKPTMAPKQVMKTSKQSAARCRPAEKASKARGPPVWRLSKVQMI